MRRRQLQMSLPAVPQNTSPRAIHLGVPQWPGKDGAIVRVVGQSCEMLASNCGEMGNFESCCTSISPPEGLFQMGRDDGDPLEGPQHQVNLTHPFSVDRYEVTVGRFRAFVRFIQSTSGQWAPAPGSGAYPPVADSGWQSGWRMSNLPADLECNGATWTPTEAGNENRPINCVSWFDAFAFCAWEGGRLPTEAEWEYTAKGGVANRPFPWGQSEPSGCVEANWSGCGLEPWRPGTEPSGDGRWEHSDLAGTSTNGRRTGGRTTPTQLERTRWSSRLERHPLASIEVATSPSETATLRTSAPRTGMGSTRWERISWLGFRCAWDP